MESLRRHTEEEEEEEEAAAAVEVTLESDDDDESGAESFLTDDELAYQEGFDPDEDNDYQEDEAPTTSAAEQQATPPASPEEVRPSEEPLPQERDYGHMQLRAQVRSTPHTRAQSRSSLVHSASGDRSRSRSRSSGESRSWSRTRSRSPLRARPKPVPPVPSWKTEIDPDICPVQKRFLPARPPGHQLNSNSTYTPLDLFKLFFSNDAAKTICQNTNKQAAKNITKGKKYSWTAINIQEFFKYVGLTFFFALMKLNNIQHYWKKNTIFSVPFPGNVMPRDRYRVISWNIHMSDPEKDVENDKKKGTPDYDHLFRLRPLLDTISDACKAFYHPRQNLSIDKRMLTSKARLGLKNIKKPQNKWGVRLFVLADSSNGYTWDFAVYTGKSQLASGVGLGYDSVMSLIKPENLGSGFHLYVDNFYTSPKLFKDLFNLNIGACGIYRDNRRECPRTCSNEPRGSIRWMRDGPLVFVKWRDTGEVTVCSTIHQAFSGSTVQRRIKIHKSEWITKSIPCPTPVVEYNKHMGGVDLSDQLSHYHSLNHKSVRWYRTLFFHFLDIAATNSFLLHKELCKERREEPMSHRAFLEELTAQLCGVTVTLPPAKAQSSHLPVPIRSQQDISRRASYGRKTCIHCRQTRKVGQSTPWKCKECDVALCLIADRNCFEAWHS